MQGDEGGLVQRVEREGAARFALAEGAVAGVYDEGGCEKGEGGVRAGAARYEWEEGEAAGRDAG